MPPPAPVISTRCIIDLTSGLFWKPNLAESGGLDNRFTAREDREGSLKSKRFASRDHFLIS